MSGLLMVGLLSLAVGAVAIFVGGLEWRENKGARIPFVLGILINFLSSVFMYDAGSGRLTNIIRRPLTVGETYATVCAVPEKNGNFAALLRDKNGEFWAYQLKQVPPPVFVMTNGGVDSWQVLYSTQTAR